MAVVAASRPTVSVFDFSNGDKVISSTPLPDVFTAPIRPDVIRHVHTQIAKNKRQAYAVKFIAGMNTAAASWGTGRAVSRIPRVPGGGTHRAGQGAFGNMCRGGRMFAPTKTWRRWHRKIQVNQKRYAVSSALAASAVPALVMAHGHRINEVPELPLVLGNGVEKVQKTKDAVDVLTKFGLGEELSVSKESKRVRAGKAKRRGRKYIIKKGPLVVYSSEGTKAATELESPMVLAFRNIPGVELSPVESLNLLQLAPGGHVGRLIVWTQKAFEKLNSVFGTRESYSELKKGFILPRPMMLNSDVGRLLNSEEVLKVIRPKISKEDLLPGFGKKVERRNPLRNIKQMLKLNPHQEVLKRKAVLASQEGLTEEGRAKKKLRLKEKKAQKKKEGTSRAQRTAFYNKMME